MENKLHLAPIAQNPQNILDIGTGSGIWAMNMADMHPGASVIGVDIAPIQPTLTPPNLYFEVCLSLELRDAVITASSSPFDN